MYAATLNMFSFSFIKESRHLLSKKIKVILLSFTNNLILFLRAHIINKLKRLTNTVLPKVLAMCKQP